jgi:hypothetical protein
MPINGHEASLCKNAFNASVTATETTHCLPVFLNRGRRLPSGYDQQLDSFPAGG